MKFYGVFVLLLIVAAQAGAQEDSMEPSEQQEVVEYKIPEELPQTGWGGWRETQYQGDSKQSNGPLAAADYVYTWNGPRQAYCEARLSKLVDGTSDFTYEHWRDIEQRLVEQWFPVGTPFNKAFNLFVERDRFGFVFKSYSSPDADEGILRDAEEHYIRFETWSLRGKTHYLQHLIYFVFDKSSPAWNSRRIQVVHNIRKKIRMSRLLDECEMEDVKRDKEKFDWNRVDHFYTEARRMGLATDWREDFPEEQLEKVVESLWEEWFSDAPVHEVFSYLLKKGFYVRYLIPACDGKTCWVLALRTDWVFRHLGPTMSRPVALDKHRLSLELFVYIKSAAGQGGIKTVRLREAKAFCRYSGIKSRAFERAEILPRIAKREGRELFE